MCIRDRYTSDINYYNVETEQIMFNWQSTVMGLLRWLYVILIGPYAMFSFNSIVCLPCCCFGDLVVGSDCLHLVTKYKHAIPNIAPQMKKTVEQMTAVRTNAPPVES